VRFSFNTRVFQRRAFEQGADRGSALCIEGKGSVMELVEVRASGAIN